MNMLCNGNSSLSPTRARFPIFSPGSNNLRDLFFWKNLLYNMFPLESSGVHSNLEWNPKGRKNWIIHFNGY